MNLVMATNLDVLNRMDFLIRDWKTKNDDRQVFLSCYRLMTGNMFQAIEMDEFHDRVWISTLLHRFANYYFDALECYDCGKTSPKIWQEVHQCTAELNLRQVQYLLMGVNAHINYDLVLTLFDLLDQEWPHLSREEQQLRYEDHCKVNEIIATSIDQVQDELINPSDLLMEWMDHVFGNLDEYLISSLITHWRQEVWDQACVLLGTKGIEHREILRAKLERSVLKRNRILAIDF
ncbi:hypothetical protein SAMN05444394_0482 [Algoriphagus halophilus]|uniref:Uncharacterized protein n=2 Tax=Algoriphagus halophilus TaxID=226505 RepID=A0A1N6D8J6_9BACT|nr:hypothetical protein SAMN05444394_0482 [Algoriphagus halophilus]